MKICQYLDNKKIVIIITVIFILSLSPSILACDTYVIPYLDTIICKYCPDGFEFCRWNWDVSGCGPDYLPGSYQLEGADCWPCDDGSEVCIPYCTDVFSSNDLLCPEGEYCITFNAVVGPCESVCGDDVCDSDEDCFICPADCGACPSVCGDDVCDSDEDCSICPADCGACPLGCTVSRCQEIAGWGGTELAVCSSDPVGIACDDLDRKFYGNRSNESCTEEEPWCACCGAIIPPPVSIGHIRIQGPSGMIKLNLISAADAISANRGVVKVARFNGDVNSAAELVETTAANASPVRIKTPQGIFSWAELP